MTKKEEKLLKGYSHQELFDLIDYNKDTGKFYWKYRTEDKFTSKRIYKSWNSRFSGKEISGGFTSKGRKYITITLKSTQLLSHRVAWFLIYNEIPDIIDHMNGDSTDNRICNLRNVTHKENIQNSKKKCTNTSGVVGVHFYKSRNKYTASITIDGKTKHLGYFDTIEEASKSRKDYETKINFKRFVE